MSITRCQEDKSDKASPPKLQTLSSFGRNRGRRRRAGGGGGGGGGGMSKNEEEEEEKAIPSPYHPRS